MRHINPDGTQGPGVPASARIGSDAYIGGDARIGSDAYIGNYANIGNYARIGNYASIGNGASIGNYASIGNGASIGNYANIGGAARVVERYHIISVLGPIGPDLRVLSCYRTETGHEITAGCWTGTLDEMKANLRDPEKHWPDADPAARERWVAEYKAVVKLLKLRIPTFHEGDQ